MLKEVDEQPLPLTEWIFNQPNVKIRNMVGNEMN